MSTLSDLSGQLSHDPDAQATVTDFLDYTEFFPSDLIRSMTLIRTFDSNYEHDTTRLHNATKTYGQLLSIPAEERPDPRELRADISTTLDHAVRCRESTYAEAQRICNVAEHLYDRLQSITRKLKALPTPPSHDPTPEPVAQSPTAGRKKLADRSRQSLFPEARTSTRNTTAHKPRSRQIIVPGEVLPPFDPSSPGALTEDDSDMERPSSPATALEKFAREKTPKVPKIHLPKIPKIPKDPKEAQEKKEKRIRPAGVMGTNVHSTVAGISVSNAMALIAAPPPDVRPGSRHAPWLKLTEWELNKLRKRMKKNADWIPSDTMSRRELSENGRGYDNFIKAKALAEATGEELFNEEPEEFVRPLVFKTATSNTLSLEESQELENRGMKLNQAKKLKKEAAVREQVALETQAIQSLQPRAAGAPVAPMLAVVPQGDTSMVYVTDEPGDLVMTNVSSTVVPAPPKSPLKRKRDPSSDPVPALAIDPALLDPALLAAVETQPASKKIKLAKTSVKSGKPTDIEVPVVLAPIELLIDPALQDFEADPSKNATAPTKADTKSKLSKATNGAGKGQDVSEVPEASGIPSSPPILAAIVLKAAKATKDSQQQTISLNFNTTSKQKAASAEPPIPGRRTSERHARRTSNVSLPSTGGTPGKVRHATPSETNALVPDVVPAPRGGRSGKRATPGMLTSYGDEGGAKVSLGTRKAAPGRKSLTLKLDKAKEKKEGAARATETPVLEVEDIDPNEERYCLCGDVSYGTMIACENDACEKEWFHLG